MASILEDHGQTIIKRVQTQEETAAKTANEDINHMSGGHQPGDLDEAVTKSGWIAVTILKLH